jgi:hypothetical protein
LFANNNTKGKILGKVKKGEVCSVSGCGKPSVRSLSPAYAHLVMKAGLRVADTKRLYLCEEHYKMIKKEKSGEDKLERWRFSG